MKSLLLSICLACSVSSFAQKNLAWKVERSTAEVFEDVVVTLPQEMLPKDFSVDTYAISYEGQLYPIEKTIDIRGQVSYISLLHQVGKNKKAKVSLVAEQAPEYPKRTYAEITHKTKGQWVRNPKRRQLEYAGGEWVKSNYIRVPDQYTDHSYYIKYEGPGWESDKVGYRFYLDWRNATDIYGKVKPNLCLDRVGVDGYDSYHNMQDWGMDVLKVGASLGIGSFGYWTGKKAFRVEIFDSLISEVTADGKLRSQVKTTYHGWDYKDKGKKTTLTSLLSIDAGSRATYQQLLSSEPIENICTGIVKDKNGSYIQKIDSTGTWSYIATYGPQSLNKDKLGMAVVVRTSAIEKITDDKDSWVVVLKPQHQAVDYYFLAAWELEPLGITSQEAFENYLDQFLRRLNQPTTLSK